MSRWPSSFDLPLYWVTTVCSLLLVRRFVTIVVRCFRLHQLSISNGCRNGKEYEHFDPYSGIELLLRVVRAYKNKRVLEVWQGFSDKIGKTFHFWVLGDSNFVTSEPENVKAILASSFAVFEHGARRRYGYGPLLGDGIFAADGAKWSEARALFRPSFFKSRTCDVSMFERHFQKFLEALPADGVSVDLQELFKRLTMDIITDLLFGSPTNTLAQKDEEGLMTFSRACEYSQKVVWRKIALGWISTLWPDREDRRSRRLLHDTVDQYVQQIVQQKPQHPLTEKQVDADQRDYVFLDSLAQRTQDPKVLRDQILSALLGGRDTTSSLLSNLFHTLARRPLLWRQLREEAASLSAESLTQDRLKKASLSRQCLQECKHISRFTLPQAIKRTITCVFCKPYEDKRYYNHLLTFDFLQH